MDGTAFVYAKLLRIFQETIYQGFGVSILLSMQLSPRTYPMFEGTNENPRVEYLRFDKETDSKTEREREREKLERIRESRRNSFQEISNRRSATPTWLFLAIPQDILPFPTHFVQFLSNFLPNSFSRTFSRLRAKFLC